MTGLYALPGGGFACTRCGGSGERWGAPCRRCKGSSCEPCDYVGCARDATQDEHGVGWCSEHAGEWPDEPTASPPTVETPVLSDADLLRERERMGRMGQHDAEDRRAMPAFDERSWLARVAKAVA